ncbi:TnsA endonuclease N-terminal domain-containing protein [Pseudogulbenkiania subflava]|uniref:TnsA endonuclease N terminal n=1 Tax=Pseudogulbenkiania subflava DSM 22618 TaxID=1123014 RepID=A0A1Y6BFL0_9NEIS|nr:TnsA endonuclease N-terminal domain-containing protein [Pseudogulbenkiania subflava]SMF08358.1 TnsA endonuclease N terminal [Pseudogulbenkiania subflava DSM 22618]
MISFNLDELATKVITQLNNLIPVRDAYHLHGHSYRGLHQSSKGVDGTIPYESGLSRDGLRMFDLASQVVMIVSEPFTMEYRLDGEFLTYTPDYLLHLRDGRRAVVEIKWKKDADSEYNQRRFKAIREVLEAADVLFAVFSEDILRSPILQRNMSLLERHRHRIISPMVVGQILGHLRLGNMRLGELVRRIGCRHTVLAVLAQGLIATDLRKTDLTDASLVRRA